MPVIDFNHWHCSRSETMCCTLSRTGRTIDYSSQLRYGDHCIIMYNFDMVGQPVITGTDKKQIEMAGYLWHLMSVKDSLNSVNVAWFGSAVST